MIINWIREGKLHPVLVDGQRFILKTEAEALKR